MKSIIEILKNKTLRVLILLTILLFIVNFGYKRFRIDGNSMENSYSQGDYFWIDKVTYKFSEPNKGDVVVFLDYKSGDFLVKRIIGLPGDTIEIIEGEIYLNGEKHIDEFSHIKISFMLTDHEGNPLENFDNGNQIEEYTTESPITLQEEQYWTIGDNRRSSWYGIVYEDEIIGKMVNQ